MWKVSVFAAFFCEDVVSVVTLVLPVNFIGFFCVCFVVFLCEIHESFLKGFNIKNSCKTFCYTYYT